MQLWWSVFYRFNRNGTPSSHYCDLLLLLLTRSLLLLRQFSEILVSSCLLTSIIEMAVTIEIHINFIFYRHQNSNFYSNLHLYRVLCSEAICCTPCMEKKKLFLWHFHLHFFNFLCWTSFLVSCADDLNPCINWEILWEFLFALRNKNVNFKEVTL